MLDLAKVEAGQIGLEKGLFSLRGGARGRGGHGVSGRAAKNGVKLELDPAVDVVEGDERRIRRVVFNLLQ